jgi:hypothetical protein
MVLSIGGEPVTDEDIVTWILRAVCDRVPSASSTSILEIEQLARNHWGGERPYIAKRSPIANIGKVPRTTFYRWMERHPQRR